jgi:N-acetylneuraminic acid mutarotase
MVSKRFRVIKFYFAAMFFSASCLHAQELHLPEPVSNNAVAIAQVSGQPTLFSFNGLAKGKTYKDIHANAFSVNLTTKESRSIAPLPDAQGRLASIAVTLNNRIFVIGGYTVAADHSEISTAPVYEYFPLENKYQLVTNIPVPVDDTVALVYQSRFIYLVSGWHDTGNVNLVQVYDSKQKRWFNATPFPGAPVFGHAGGMVNDQLLIADGVKVNRVVNGKREYGPSDENWLGRIDSKEPAVIHWTKIKKHPFKPLYRMAATGVNKIQQIIFAGGSDNPYNYDGIGYDKRPSGASSALFSYDLNQSRWLVHPPLPQASMDHRGLLQADEALYIVGGMGDNQKVLSRIQKIPLSKLIP